MSQTAAKARYVAIAAALLFGTAPALSTADVYLIANSALNISVDDVRSVYTGDKELVGATKIKPTDNRAAQSEFLSKVLMLNSGRYESLWTMKSFRDGLTQPTVKASDEEVIAYVQATAGAIGYVTTAPPSGVVVVKKF